MSVRNEEKPPVAAGGIGEATSASFYYPRPHTVTGRVLGALLRGECLTHLGAWRRFASSRLSQHVFLLRERGWPIIRTDETVTTKDAGRLASIGVYWMDAEFIVYEVGTTGEEYAAKCARIEVERRLP